VTNTLNCFDLGDIRSVDIVVEHPAHAFKIRGVGHYTGTNGGVAKPGTGGSGYMGQDEKAYTIATSQDQYVAHAFNHQSGGDMRGIDLREYPQLQAHQQTSVLHGMAVRRLTPTECERLQGFPDGYTDIIHYKCCGITFGLDLGQYGCSNCNGQKVATLVNTPDGSRYKALGNSMAVPVMRWIGSRIALATK